MLAPHASRAAEVDAASVITVPAGAFDPVRDGTRPPTFPDVGDVDRQSERDVDYWLVQSTGRLTSEWRNRLAARGAEVLVVLQKNAVLVRIPDGRGGANRPI
jgi:hypothetical protein